MLGPTPTLLVAAALLACSAAACFDPIPAGTLRASAGSIGGRVRHLCTGAAMVGVEVLAYRVVDGKPDFGRGRGPRLTDSKGEFLLDGLEPGTWQLNLRKGGFDSVARPVGVYTDERRWVEESLSPAITAGPSTTKLDLLFVVDNSASMQEEQQALAQAFPSFMSSLQKILADQTLDLRLGVVSTDLGAGSYTIKTCKPGGDGGRLQRTPRKAGCAPPSDPYIAVAGGQQNFKGTIGNTFSCIAELGTDGCGFEQPLAAALLALDGKTNPGFARPDAALGVFVLSDEDDCSAADTSLFNPGSQALGPPTSFRCFHYGFNCDVNDWMIPGPRKGCVPYYTFLTDLDTVVTGLRRGRDHRKVFFAAISGSVNRVEVFMNDQGQPDLKPSCSSKAGVAYPGLRLKAVADKLGPYGDFNTLCDGDLVQILEKLATEIVKKAIFNPCK